jgi:putative flippase GtrA
MESTTTDKPRQPTRHRLVWFIVGGVVNYLLISMPFKWLKLHTELPLLAVSALSLAVSTSFFFVWNYFVNFRTDSRKRDAFARYVTATLVLWVVSSSLLTLFKSFKGGLAFQLAGFPLDLDIVTLQLCLGWLKFIVYHKWAFPSAK